VTIAVRRVLLQRRIAWRADVRPVVPVSIGF
jgi:hypothetical protein